MKRERECCHDWVSSPEFGGGAQSAALAGFGANFWSSDEKLDVPAHNCR